MSLSGQYLEELSRRYKKQVEEMQKAFEKKLSAVNDELKRREEREVKMQEQLIILSESLNALLTERDGFWKIASLISQFLFMEIFVACILIYFCWRSPDDKGEISSRIKSPVKKRRQSIDTVGHETPVIKKSRRPSEEALKISGTYEDLLIPDSQINWPLTKAEKRRRRKKNAVLQKKDIENRDINSKPLLKKSASFHVNEVVRKQSAPAQLYVNGEATAPVPIQEISVALDESEHTPVVPLRVFNQEKENQISMNLKSVKNGGVKPLLKSSPIFMKTAMAARTKRTGKLSFFKTDKVNGKIEDKNESSQRGRSPDLSIASNNISDSTDDRSSVGSTSVKKDKKTSGFKRIFKKVFE